MLKNTKHHLSLLGLFCRQKASPQCGWLVTGVGLVVAEGWGGRGNFLK